jgi:hypothetical protein
MTADVASARTEWEESFRRLREASGDATRSVELQRQLDVVSDELRKRVGATFTLRELADEYRRAERWSRDAVAERAPSADWPASLALVEGAAFHLYARGAQDYEP